MQRTAASWTELVGLPSRGQRWGQHSAGDSRCCGSHEGPCATDRTTSPAGGSRDEPMYRDTCWGTRHKPSLYHHKRVSHLQRLVLTVLRLSCPGSVHRRGAGEESSELSPLQVLVSVLPPLVPPPPPAAPHSYTIMVIATPPPAGTERGSKQNEASRTMLCRRTSCCTRRGEASGLVLPGHTRDLQHQSVKMKGQISRLPACTHIASRGVK